MKKALVVGGTSGLGYEVASLLQARKYDTFVTGRKISNSIKRSAFIPLDLSRPDYVSEINNAVMRIAPIDVLVYAAGFRQRGPLRELTRQNIEAMTQVGLVAPAMFLRMLLQVQRSLPMFVAVTSTSEWTPRADEPMYCAAKAGLGMFAECVSLDESIGKTLTVGVSGMNTPFWENSGQNVDSYLDPAWVAAQVLESLQDEYKYRFVKILRDPKRVEVAKERII
jgi:NAD(P)-dependent dehydrogenase (short-subunit alcohol dehydrogenase family)